MDLEQMAREFVPEVFATSIKEEYDETVLDVNHADVNIKKEQEEISEESGNCYPESCSNNIFKVEEDFSSVNECENFEPLTDLGVTDAINSKNESLGEDKCHVKSDVCMEKQDIELGSVIKQELYNKSYKCDHCKFTCVSEKDFNQHSRSHFMEKSHNCDVCGYGTNNRKYFNDHVRKHNNTPYKCLFCQYSFHKPSELKNHFIIKHTDYKHFKCEYCEYTCKVKKMLNLHLRKHNEKNILCKYCNFSCNQNSDLVIHTFYKHREYCTANTFKCQECGKEFIKQRELRIHQSTHTKQYPNHCSECNYSCSRKDILELHIKKYHTKQEKEIKCPKCDYTCFNHTQLKRHSVVHTNIRFFSCDLCDYVCRKRWTLQEHQLKEHNTISFNAESKAKCDKCEYVAVDKRELMRHSVVHTGEKFFKCEYCKYVCRSRKMLPKHQLKEHNVAGIYSNMKCDKCEYVAIDTRDLKRHLVVHTGDRFFKCEHCQYVCRHNKTLKDHKLKDHSDDIKKELQQSDDIFINENPSENHQKKQHIEKDQPISSIVNNSITNLLKITDKKDTLNESIIEHLKDEKIYLN